MTRMMCWKAEIWAEAGVARPSAASVNGNSLFTTLPPVTNLYCHNRQRNYYDTNGSDATGSNVYGSNTTEKMYEAANRFSVARG